MTTKTRPDRLPINGVGGLISRIMETGKPAHMTAEESNRAHERFAKAMKPEIAKILAEEARCPGEFKWQ